MEKKGWREELKILLEREEEEILLAERVAKPYSGKRREDIYNFVEKEIEKGREEEIQKILDKMPQYVERNGREYYLDFYIKDISGERYYCSCYTNGDKKLTPEYDEEILLRSLVKTRDYLSKLKQ